MKVSSYQQQQKNAVKGVGDQREVNNQGKNTDLYLQVALRGYVSSCSILNKPSKKKPMAMYYGSWGEKSKTIPGSSHYERLTNQCMVMDVMFQYLG